MISLTTTYRSIGCLLITLCAAGLVCAASRDITPSSDNQVIEKLAPRVRISASTPEAAAKAARQAITLARQTADVRYLGRAQATLQRWWDQADAPVELAVLQATVHQSRHEFAAAHRVLQSALQREPLHAQGWLTMATIERVAGRYPAALTACAAVERAGAALYAAACMLETRSLQGQHDEATQGFDALRRQTKDSATQAWLLSLAAENEERAGRDAAALTAYQSSLALDKDTYTALGAADLLLRTGRAAQALPLLTPLPDSDAVLLRRAYAAKLLGNTAWQDLATQLRQRIEALDQRGDDPVAHARERALMHLWLDADGARALTSAQLNLTLQKEPFDWWLALQSAQLAGQTNALDKLQQGIAATGLRDARLAKK
jgi:tetratricopeptide (TPR) repeat protein